MTVQEHLQRKSILSGSLGLLQPWTVTAGDFNNDSFPIALVQVLVVLLLCVYSP